MYKKQSKKLLIICILEILREYSDENHRLKQQAIIDYLKKDYDMECDRKSVKANIVNLIEFGYDVECEEIVRRNKDGEEEIISTDWYLVHDFDDSELKLLINSILFSKMIPINQAKVLIEKIKGLSNHYFSAKVRHICNLPELHHTDNKNVLYNLDIIDDAIDDGKKVSFIYNEYGTDKKMHPKRDRKYVVNPYQLVANNGRYYLICNYDKYDNVSYYRIDRMTELEILESKVKPMPKVKGLENGLNLPKHMAEHIYMFSNDTESIKLKVKKYIIGEVIDWFGKDFILLNEDEMEATIRITCSLQAMFYWTMQYGNHIEVLEPTRLRNQIIDTINEMSQKYGNPEKRGEII